MNHIILSLDSNLNLIAFAAALVDKNNRYLIENYKIAVFVPVGDWSPMGF